MGDPQSKSVGAKKTETLHDRFVLRSLSLFDVVVVEGCIGGGGRPSAGI